jgi:RNA 3'-terminal phosphate cyclase (ATP)
MGEGGGQILRSALALSMITREPIHIQNIRAGRSKPGLLRQHLAAVRAAGTISGAQLGGDDLGSRELWFKPGPTQPGKYQFDIGSAGSTTLVLQTILPPLLRAQQPSSLTLLGGTHNPHAPPVDFLERAFLPIIERIGPRVSLRLARYGFYPAGGGRLLVDIKPAPLAAVHLSERGEIRRCSARAVVAGLEPLIAERELAVVRQELAWPDENLESIQVEPGQGPGNVLTLLVESEHVAEVFTGFGQRGVRAEVVAEGAVQSVRRYLEAGVPVGSYLADQLLLPLALAGGGSFVTQSLSQHAETNISVIEMFLGVRFAVRELEGRRWLVEINGH